MKADQWELLAKRQSSGCAAMILDQADWLAWLGEATVDRAKLLRSAPDGTLRTWAVSTRANTPWNNNSELLAAL